MGAMVTQATSPMFSHKAFWCIEETLNKTNLHTIAYHTYIPSFGEWGFVIATKYKPKPIQIIQPKNLKYINTTIFKQMQIFATDIAKPNDIKSNKLISHELIYYYNDGWKKWYE
jgi:spermidine synthase